MKARKHTIDEVRTPQTTPHFPKFYKTNIPGIPVVSLAEFYTSEVSNLMNYFLHPHPKSLPSEIKYTSDFINKTNEKNINTDIIHKERHNSRNVRCRITLFQYS